MTQHKALELADALDAEIVRTVKIDVLHHEAAAELRRMHDLLGKANALCSIRAKEIEDLKAVNAELLDTLKQAWPQLIGRTERLTRDVIARVEGVDTKLV